jgi:hypothetical protein
MPAEPFIVQAPGFPLFHPKDCPAVVDFLGGEVKVQTYAYWSGTIWIRTDLPVTIKANTPLYLRSTNVTVCPDGPTASTPTSKRKHSLTAADNSPSPQRPRIERWVTSVYLSVSKSLTLPPAPKSARFSILRRVDLDIPWCTHTSIILQLSFRLLIVAAAIWPQITKRTPPGLQLPLYPLRPKQLMCSVKSTQTWNKMIFFVLKLR